MSICRVLIITALTLSLWGCATNKGQYGQDLDLKPCDGAGKEHKDKYTIVETLQTSSYEQSDPIKLFNGIGTAQVEGSNLVLILVNKSLYEEYSTPRLTKLKEIHYDAHPILSLFTNIFTGGIFLITIPKWVSNLTFGCTEKRLQSPELDFTNKVKTGKFEWRDIDKIHKFLVSGFDKDYEVMGMTNNDALHRVDIDLSSIILSTELSSNTNLNITCLDCNLLSPEEQNLYKDVKKTVELTADFRGIKKSLVNQSLNTAPASKPKQKSKPLLTPQTGELE